MRKRPSRQGLFLFEFVRPITKLKLNITSEVLFTEWPKNGDMGTHFTNQLFNPWHCGIVDMGHQVFLGIQAVCCLSLHGSSWLLLW
jgi:hypothetical protein